MEPVDASDCLAHICVCTNEKPGGKECCAKVGGKEFFDKLKARARETGISATRWVTRTGCLGWCNSVGTTVVIHKPGAPSRWFYKVTDADFEDVWKALQE